MNIQSAQDEELKGEILSSQIKEMLGTGQLERGFKKITAAMQANPHSPVPHNLLGILLQREGNRVMAMKHYRAAYYLDPTYLPAIHNLSACGTKGNVAFDERDCKIQERKIACFLEYDNKNIGHIVRRKIK